MSDKKKKIETEDKNGSRSRQLLILQGDSEYQPIQGIYIYCITVITSTIYI